MGRLVYYLHDDPSSLRIQLNGTLSASNAAELERCWRTGSSTLGSRAWVVDLDSLLSVDDAGRRLLLRWRELGARLVGESTAAKAIMESVAESAGTEPRAVNY